MREPAYYIGKPVRSLQTMLRTVAIQGNTLPTVVPDGIYGAETMRSVQAFQKSHCLPPTGITDLHTWQAITAEFERARIETSPAEPLVISLSPNEAIAPDSNSPYVLLLQAMLHTVSGYYENLTDCHLCGRYDDATEAAVMCLQRAADLPETGVCDKQLWRLLTGLYTQVTATQPAACPAEKPPQVEKPSEDAQQNPPDNAPQTPRQPPHAEEM